MLRVLAKLLLLILPLTACAQSPSATPRAGVDYEVLEQGQRWLPVVKGRMEVVEFFAYWCGHCAHFQPMVDTWKKTKPKDVDFTYVPAVYDDAANSYASAYFAAEIADVLPKTHSQLFAAIHQEGNLPTSNATIDEMGTYFAERGLNRAKMIALMESKQVAERMKHAHAFAVANKLQKTPLLVLNGKYVISGQTLEDRLRTVDALIIQERKAAAGKR